MIFASSDVDNPDEASPSLNKKSLLVSDTVRLELDAMSEQMDQAAREQEQQQKIIISSVKGMTMVVTVGFLNWVLRAGSLLASVLASTPLWKQFDPVTVIALSSKERKQQQAALQEDEKRENRDNKHLGYLLSRIKSAKAEKHN